MLSKTKKQKKDEPQNFISGLQIMLNTDSQVDESNRIDRNMIYKILHIDIIHREYIYIYIYILSSTDTLCCNTTLQCSKTYKNPQDTSSWDWNVTDFT